MAVDRSTLLVVVILVVVVLQLHVRVCPLSLMDSGGSTICVVVDFVCFCFRLILLFPGKVINTTPSLNLTLHNRTPHPE